MTRLPRRIQTSVAGLRDYAPSHSDVLPLARWAAARILAARR